MKRPGRESWAVLLFSVGLACSNVALPLTMIDAGFSGRRIGVLTAVSAVAQLAARPSVPWIAARLPDRALVGLAALTLACACLTVAASRSLLAFEIAELAQGASRGFFWSGTQLHAVRRGGSAIRAIAAVNLYSGTGALIGPAAAGWLCAVSTTAALGVGAGLAAAASAVTLTMDRLPLLVAAATGSATKVYTRRPVILACLASASAGAWSSLNASYIPVALARDQSLPTVGLLISTANGGNMLASVGVGHRRITCAHRVLRPAALLGGGCFALVGFAAGTAWTAGLLLFVAGVGCGALVTLGPAMATEAVADGERAHAIALAGTFRAVAMFAAPMAIAGALPLIGLRAALVAVGASVALPGIPRRVKKEPAEACPVAHRATDGGPLAPETPTTLAQWEDQ